MLWYFVRQGHRELFTDPYRAVPGSASIVVESADLKSFMNSLTAAKGPAAELLKLKELEVISARLRFLADQLNKPDFNLIVTEGPSVLAFFPSPQGRLMPLLAMTISPDTREKDVRALVSAAGGSPGVQGSSGGRDIIIVPFRTGPQSDTLFVSLVPGLLLASLSGDLLQEAIVQTGRSGDVREEPGFLKVHSASGEKENKIFILFHNSSGLLQRLFRPEASDIARRISSVRGTAGADIHIDETGLILSGYIESPDSSSFTGKYRSLRSTSFKTYRVLPASTVMFRTQVLVHDTSEVRAGGGEAAALASKIARLAAGEITWACLGLRDSPLSENMLLVCELTNSALAEQAVRESTGGRDDISLYVPDDQSSFFVYRNRHTGATGLIEPGFVKDFDDSFISFYQNYLIAGSSLESVTRFIHENILNKTLGNDLIYRDFENLLPSTAGYSFYCVPGAIGSWLAAYLNADISSALMKYSGELAKIQAAGMQLASSNRMIYNSMALSYREEAREESRTEWETLLDTVAAVKPFFFTNHNTGAREIFVQDLKNNAYLINSAGRVLWKVQLQERINGSIYMVDVYRNGKYQLLFSGKNFIHMLDRNGNYVDRYPFRLRSPATSPLALFDYDNNSNYRLFIAGEDRKIYSYDKNGNTVKGWKPYTTPGPVTEEISYFRVSGKDYLVASDGMSLHFLDRTGNTRVTLAEPVAKAPGSALRLTQGSNPSVVCTGKDGTIYNIGFDGSVRKQKIKVFGVDHHSDLFDVDGDGFGEYIFIDKGMLYLYDHDMKEMFIREFSTDNLAGPINFVFSSSDRKIGVADLAGKRIYLIDRNGTTMSGFPLRGASMFSIGKLSEKGGWNLVVGGTDRFLYNYKLETEIK